MFDFTIDATSGDMGTKVLTGGHFKLTETTGVAEVVQRVRTRVQKQLGEWRYNLDSGVPWLDYGDTPGVLGAVNGNNVDIAGIIQPIVSATDGVTAVGFINARFNSATREYTIQIELETIYGNAKIVI